MFFFSITWQMNKLKIRQSYKLTKFFLRQDEDRSKEQIVKRTKQALFFKTFLCLTSILTLYPSLIGIDAHRGGEVGGW
jgi:hypothetical protein